jgi:hypothetical protein
MIGGKIYIIKCNKSKKCYIGSTTKSLDARIFYHTRSNNECSSKIIIESGDYSYSILEDCICENRDKLRQRERYYQDLYKESCINIRRAIVSKDELKAEKVTYDKQYREINKGQKKLKDKNYFEIKKNERFLCGCGKTVSMFEKSRHNRSLIHQRFITEEKA